MFNAGDVVIILSDHPYGRNDSWCCGCRNEIGIIHEIDISDKVPYYMVHTLCKRTDMWYWAADELRLASDEEIKNRFVALLKGKD